MIASANSEMRAGANGAATFVLFFVQALVSLAASAVTFFDGMSVGPCVTTCDYDLKWFAFAFTPTVALWMFVVAVVANIVLRIARPGRLTWWIPAVGIVVGLTALLVSLRAADIAMAV